VLFMDEPFIGLFDSEKKLLISYLQKIKNHTTIFIIANDAEVWQINDRMISLTDGEATIKELR